MSTPIRSQYLQIKKQHPEAILFFRLGDFYETFDEDAEITARELDIVLTSREMGKGRRVPLAGIPYHAAEGYIAKLVNRGYKVAICEQMGEVRSKGLVDRQVIRVVTPGTVVEPSMLEPRHNNYLVAAILEAGRAGLAYVDITTGEFATTQFSGDNVETSLQQEVDRLHPAELLSPAESADGSVAFGISSEAAISPYEPWHWDLDTARGVLLRHFEVASLEGYGCARLPLAIRASGALLQYLQETNPTCVRQLTHLSTYSTQSYMSLDAQTRRNLELLESGRDGSKRRSLLSVLDQTRSSMGSRLLAKWVNQPLLDLDRLQSRQEAIAAFVDNTALRLEIISLLSNVGDLERLANRAVQGVATPRDLVALRTTLEMVGPLANLLEEHRSSPSELERKSEKVLDPLIKKLDPCPEIITLVAEAIADDAPQLVSAGGVIKAGFSSELDTIRSAARDGKQWIAGLEKKERERSGIKSLKVGYNRVFGYYIEVSKANASLVPQEYIRKQTLVDAERYITPELKEYESLVLNAEEKMGELEGVIFKQIVQQVAAAPQRLLGTAKALAHLDIFAALAEVAVRHSYVRPDLNTSGQIIIRDGRHPVVELALVDEFFVPNDAHLDPEESQVVILTGPNMAGKSTYLRQVALIVLMAQIGSFVPAEGASIGLVDRIFTRVGAQDDIATGQSTFMVEMVETANILYHATRRSLIVLDEIGRGTSTYDGLAIAKAVVEYIHNSPRLGAKTLFATHYHELTEMEKYLPRVVNYNVAVREESGRVIFLRKIVPGGADRSYGIHVAQLAGLPKSIIRRASDILADLEKNGKREERRKVAGDGALGEQLSLFSDEPDPVLEEIKNLSVDEMSPLEAIGKLYELQRKIRE